MRRSSAPLRPCSTPLLLLVRLRAPLRHHFLALFPAAPAPSPAAAVAPVVSASTGSCGSLLFVGRSCITTPASGRHRWFAGKSVTRSDDTEKLCWRASARAPAAAAPPSACPSEAAAVGAPFCSLSFFFFFGGSPASASIASAAATASTVAGRFLLPAPVAGTSCTQARQQNRFAKLQTEEEKLRQWWEGSAPPSLRGASAPPPAEETARRVGRRRQSSLTSAEHAGACSARAADDGVHVGRAGCALVSSKEETAEELSREWR